MDVKKVIKERGWTQVRVAKKLDISNITLAQILARNPTVNTLQRIADVIGCKVGDFFKDDLTPEEPQNTIICPHCGKLIKFEKEGE